VLIRKIQEGEIERYVPDDRTIFWDGMPSSISNNFGGGGEELTLYKKGKTKNYLRKSLKTMEVGYVVVACVVIVAFESENLLKELLGRIVQEF